MTDDLEQEIRDAIKSKDYRACGRLMKNYIKRGIVDEWKRRAEAHGIPYIPGEPPQNTRKRIREAMEKEEELDKELEIES